MTRRQIRTIARNVKRMREGQELTQEQLAAEADLSRFVIQSLERGERSPRTRTLRNVAKALGTTPAELRGDDFADLPPLVRPTDDREAKLARLRELQAEQQQLEAELGETGT